MANITYLLGAGASFHSCPILNKQADAMLFIAETELKALNDQIKVYNFTLDEEEKLKSNQQKVLWRIGYYGKKAKEFGTIDTYARKLDLQKEATELNLLKMSISVFFDLWESFYDERYWKFDLKINYPENDISDYSFDRAYESIDKRYASLFSIFLENNGNQVRLNDSVKFISWNYDLQLEKAFKLFLKEEQASDLNKVNGYFVFLENEKSNLKNEVFHLNGHRGFYDYKRKSRNGMVEEEIINTIRKESFDQYWEVHSNLYDETINRSTSFQNYIKYAWEHDTDSPWFNQIKEVLKNTDVLIIIGYSFPLFNRKIDQLLMKNLKQNRLKEIVYQDPNANEELIKNLFESPRYFDGKLSPKIRIEDKNKKQFDIPHSHFITQKTPTRSFKSSTL